MKRLFAGMAAALLAAVLFFPVKAEAISAQQAILMDAQTGRILYEKSVPALYIMRKKRIPSETY